MQVVGAIGVPMKVHATGMLANVADPAVIELRYDATLFDGYGHPARRPGDRSRWSHADGPDDPYFAHPVLPGPRGHAARATFCLRRPVAPAAVDGNTLVMVVRTIDTSRWIAH